MRTSLFVLLLVLTSGVLGTAQGPSTQPPGTQTPPVTFRSEVNFVEVPAGARFLFVSPADSFFSDNADPDGDFGIGITVVPEPSGLVLAGVGLAGLLGGVWRRGRRPR